jgi:diguanylate cyclase
MDLSFEILARSYRKVVGARRRAQPELFEHLAPLYLAADFLGRHGIDPNPANYELVYRHQVLEERALDPVIERLVHSPYTNSWTTGSENGRLSGDDLREIADAVQSQLDAVEQAIGAYAHDTTGYGKALQDKSRQFQSGANNEAILERLIALTKNMVEKARDAERELKDRNDAVRNLKSSLADARMKADTDMLTGLSNRRAFERALGAACARAESGRTIVSLAICDIDHFKSINDRFGHITGDRVLKLVSDILQSHCGAHADVCRFGGEEFVILFEGMGVEDAYDLVESAKIDLGDRHLVKRESKEAIGRVTFSAGLAGFAQANSPESLLHIADLALYEAKANGRDCIFGASNSQLSKKP